MALNVIEVKGQKLDGFKKNTKKFPRVILEFYIQFKLFIQNG